LREYRTISAAYLVVPQLLQNKGVALAPEGSFSSLFDPIKAFFRSLFSP
jgi:hypothetical protein